MQPDEDDDEDDDEDEDDEMKHDGDGDEDIEAAKHPFLLFLVRMLDANPNTDKRHIQQAVRFWRVKMEHADALMQEAIDNARVKMEHEDDGDNDQQWIENQATFYDERGLDDRGIEKLKEIQSRFQSHDDNNANCILM